MDTITFPRRKFIRGIPRMDFHEPDVICQDIPTRVVFDETLGFARLYTHEGLLILISTGYGSAWSADACGCTSKRIRTHLLMDARIVQFFYDTYIAPLVAEPRKCDCGLICSCSVDEEPMKQFLHDYFTKLGYEEGEIQRVFLDGLRNLQIELVPTGMKFRVTEYDGMESLMIYNPETWHSS